MEFSFKEKDNNNIRRAILKTVVFFDMFDFPLTVIEVWKYLGKKCELTEVMEILEELNFKTHPNSPFKIKGESMIELKNGFYFLAGRSEIVETRIKRYNFAFKKFKRAVRVAKVFKFIPWVKMIAVGNIMGGNNAKAESDIDLFIISEKKRIWLTRFFCVVITKFFGLRPHGHKMRDTICLSFFVSEEAMELKGLMITDMTLGSKLVKSTGTEPTLTLPFVKGGKYDDIYFIYWLANLEAIYDQGGVYEKFIGANSWIYSALPNWQAFIGTYWRDAGQPMSFLYHDIIDLFFSGLEKNFKNWQIKKLPLAIKEIMNQDTRVVVTDDVFKSHVNDRREYYRNLYLEKIDKTNF